MELPSLVINISNDCRIRILKAYLDVKAVLSVFHPWNHKALHHQDKGVNELISN